MRPCLRLCFALFFAAIVAVAHGGTTGTALVRHAPSINGTVDGSLQQMTGESATLNGGSTLTADWLVPGTPAINLNGKPTYGGTAEGSGVTTPTGYTLTLNGGATLGHVVRRTNPIALPVVTAPPQPTGTRTVTINAPGEAIGSFSTLRHLTLNGNVGQFAIPGGTYGDFTANGGSGFTFGAAGSTQPTVYNFQHLTLNGLTTINVVGPVVINIANGFTANGNMGSSQNLAWLTVNIYTGAFTLNGGCSLYGSLKAPNSTVTINGNSQLIGGLACDRLIVNGRGLVRLSDLSSAPPSVTITAPANNSIYAAPASIAIQATAADPDGAIAKVDFYAGTTLIGSASSAPYQVTWSASLAGTYSLTAVATDNSGQAATSPSITVIVDSPPAVTITAPTANTVFSAPASFAIQATATDSDGTIAKVAFFNGTTKLGESTASPYQFAWSNVPSGSYSLTAVATDDRGIATSSAAVAVVVNALPAIAITAPASGASYTAPASISLEATASDSDGTIAKVQFYNGATLLGESTIAPYQFTWAGVGTGSYSVTAVAIDNRGGTATSAAVTLQVISPNSPPIVGIASPHPGDVFTAPASFNLIVNASDSDGTVSKVEFFQGATKLGEAFAAPYQIAVTGLDSGSHTFTARATDNQGAVATSAPVTIVANAAPTVALTAPADGTVVAAPANVLLQANASDVDGSVTKVEFFSGTTKLGEATGVPYQYNWANVPAGTYSLKAVATDNRGATATSAIIALTVDTPPTISITAPANNAVFEAPATIVISTAAADTDGSVAKVEFFADGAKIGESLAAPFQFTWTGMPAGAHVLSARVTDNHDIATESAPVSILINVPPVVTLSAPDDGAIYLAPGAFTVRAEATDSDGTIAKIEFFDGTTKLGESTTTPYQLPLSNLPAGTYRFTAKATDDQGSVGTSGLVSVVVNAPPTVSMATPADGTVFPALTDLELSATAADSDGVIAKVEFYAGANKIGEATAAPYTFTWAAVPSGTYAVTARAIDNYGATGTSPAITVIANSAPAVALTAPVSDSIVLAPATVAIRATATDADGSVAKVEFFNGAAKLGEVTTAPYDFTWNNVPSGSYTLTARATDNYGASSNSGAVVIVVNNAPTVTLDSPAAGATFPAPATIALRATPADSDGTIAKVEFYAGATKVGEALGSPYQLSWTNVPYGSYTLTAKAIDNLGATAVSASVPVVVNAAPVVTLTAPTNGAFLQPGTAITLSATATDQDGSVAKVEFFSGTTKLGELLTPSLAPSTFNFTLGSGLPSGAYTVSAKVTDNLGAAATSPSVAFTVNTAPVATPMIVAATPGQPMPVTLIGTDVNGTTLTFSTVAQPQHGSLSGTPPNLTYTAAADFGGFDSFTFVANDGQLTSAPATVEITSNLPPRSHTYTTTADFSAGTLSGVSTDTADQISNRTVLASFDVIWIANSTKGTVVKLDSETGRVVGEYASAPTSVGSVFPSRIAVDSKGNAWVANGSHNSIIKIGLPEFTGWIDRNNNGLADTSTGLGDIKPWPTDSVATAADEAILLYVATGINGVHHISVDADDNVWVGGSNGPWEKYDGHTGQRLRADPTVGRGGMGGFIAADGTMYSAGADFLISGTATAPVTPLAKDADIQRYAWASALDSKGNLWVTQDGVSTVSEYSPTGELIAKYYHGEPWAMGIAIDANDHVWIAHSHCGHTVGHLLPTGEFVGNVAVANHGPIEVSIDRRGRIWVTSSTGVVERINPLGGPIGADGVTPIGEVDLRSGNLGGGLWTYGRFTGNTSGLTSPDGLWTATFDGQLANSTWGQVVWNGLLCNDAKIVVDAALSADGQNFGPYETLTVANPTPSGSGRFLKTRVRLVSASTGENPTLYDLTVGTSGYAAPTTTPSWYVSAGPGIKGNWPDVIQLRGAFCHSAHSYPVEPTYSWSTVSGPASVTFTNPADKRTTAKFTAQGTYVLRLTGVLNGVVSTSDVSVTLSPYNRAPYANAGYTTFIASFPPQVWLWGEVRDDGLPVGAAVTSTWTGLFGPATPTFGNASAPTTTASFPVPGVYTLQLAATDTEYTTTNTTDVWVGVPPPPPPPDGLVSWWEASGNGDDHISGNQAFLERAASYQNGKLGGGFRLDGASGRVHVFAAPSLDVSQEDGLTIEFWAKPTSERPATMVQYGGSGAGGVCIRQQYQAIEVNLKEANGTDHLFTTGNLLPTNGWTHIAATYNRANGDVRIYVNGILRIAQRIGSQLVLATGGDFFMGARSNNTEPFAGILDEVSIYRRAIYGDEANTIATIGKRPPVSNLPPTVNAGPKLFNQHVGATVSLNGMVTDDGQPTNGQLTIAWSKLSGPGGASFTNGNKAAAQVTFTAPGRYVLQLAADDGAFNSTSTTEVMVDAFYSFETDGDLAAWWNGDDQDVDAVHGLKLERFNGASFGDGEARRAFAFNGGANYAKCDASPNIDIGASAKGFTVEFWTKPNPSQDAPLVQWSNGPTSGLRFSQGGQYNYLYCALVDTSGVTHSVDSRFYFDGGSVWTHIALTYDRTTGIARLYRNGALMVEQNLGKFAVQTTYPLVVGQNWGGTIDELSLFTRPLALSEVVAIYQAGAKGKTPLDNDHPPVITAGSDVLVPVGSLTATLSGNVTDDGLPAGGVLNLTWNKLNGPGTVTYGNQYAKQTTATFSAPGVYVMRLDANDGYNETAGDTMVVYVGVDGSIETDSSLAAWWPANGDTREVVHGNHDMEFLPSGPTFQSGQVSEAFSMAGGRYGRVAAHPDLDIGTSSRGFTIEFWAKPSQGQDAPLVTWTNGVNVTQGGQYDYLYCSFPDTNGQPHNIDGRFFFSTGNTWTHVAITYDKATGIARLYRNGGLYSEKNVGSFTAQTSGMISFGQGWSGLMDEISFYTRPLPSTAIQAIYSAAANGKSPMDDNQPPAVSAGPDVQVLTTGGAATLNGTVDDDGHPTGGQLTIQWSKVSGPGTPQFTDEHAAHTTATFTTPGIYVLKLAASDGFNQASDTVVVHAAVVDSYEGPAGLSAWWPANGELHEVVHGGHDIEFLPSGVTYSDGAVSQAFQFAGGSGRIAAHRDLDVGSSTQGLTIEFWAKPSQGQDAPILSWTDGTNQGVYLSEGGQYDYLYCRLYDTAGQPHNVDARYYFTTKNVWTHVVLTYDKATGKARLYQNGSFWMEENLGSFTPQTSYPLVLGQNWIGGLDELSLYTRALTSTEVQALYLAGSSGKSPIDDNQPPVVTAGPDVRVTAANTAATLLGSVRDDGHPVGGVLTSKWRKLDGPAEPQFGDSTVPNTTVTFPVAGTYILELSATDGMNRSRDTMVAYVGLTNLDADNSLAAWWPGNGEVHEMVHGGHDLEFLPNGVHFTAGQVSEAFNIGGGSARAEAHPDLDIGTSSQGFTIEFWARPTQGQDETVLGWTNGTSTGVTFVEGGQYDYLYCRIYDTTGQSHNIDARYYFTTKNVWTHVALTYDRATGMGRLYQNGALWSEQNLTIFTPQTSYPFVLGPRWQGALDEISLYTKPLTPAQIQAIYQAGTNGKTPIIPNLAPIVNAGADVTAYINTSVALNGGVVDDGLPNPPAAVTQQWSKVSGPGNVSFTNGTAAVASATFDAVGTYVLRLTASDSALGASDEATVTIVNPPPSVQLTAPAQNTNVLIGQTVTLQATATAPAGSVAKVEFFDGTTKLGQATTPNAGTTNVYSYGATFGAGSHVLTARVTDTTGATATSGSVSIKAVTYAGESVIKITAPADTARVSAPTDVTGIVADSAVASWTVVYRLKAAEGAALEPWRTLATGTSLVGTPAANGGTETPGKFGTFDPTSLINGLYELQLQVMSTGGSTTLAPATPMTVIVEGNMKVGVFSLAFEDLKVPVAGIPITVTRTYDSRDTRIGDFGPGWRLSVANVRVQKNRTLGLEWYQTLQSGNGIQHYFVDPMGDRLVTVVMPDGETHRFKAGAYVKRDPNTGYADNDAFPAPATTGKLRFYPVGDTTSKLEPLNTANELADTFYLTGTGDQDLYSEDPSVDFTAGIFNTSRFRLTTKEGTVYLVDEVLGLLSVQDLSGNTLIVNRDGQRRVTSIVSTLNAATPVVTSVIIHRDGTGRVDYIRDPAGNDVDYLYDTQGRLSSFTNRELNVTQFYYENAAFPYYLTRIVDPRGVNAIRSEYDTNGKLIKQIDASGKETVFTHPVDPAARVEKVKDRLGNETTFYYDNRGNVTTKIDPLGAQTTFAYYPDSDRVKLQTDHYGNVKSMAYDAHGNVLVETVGANASEDPANPTTGHTSRTTYNGRSAPTQVTDPDGRVLSYTYDPATNNLLSQTMGQGGSAPSTMTFAYNPDGTVKSQTDAVGNVTSYAYDYAFIDTTYPGAVKKVTVTVTDPAGSAGSDTTNAADTILRSTATLHDAQDNPVAQILTRHLPDGTSQDIVTRFTYDTENRRRTTILPDGRVDEVRYNAIGKSDKTVQWQSVADYQSGDDSKARVTSYVYDTRGNQTSVSYPDGTSEQAHFDAEGRKDWSQDRRGYRTFFIHDAVGRLTSTILPDSDDGVATAAPTSVNEARLGNNPRKRTVYDLAGRVTDIYDEMNRRTSTVYYPDGTADAGRRKQSVLVRTVGNLVTSYQYDGSGNVRFVTDPRGNITETQYDDQGRPRFVLYSATDEHPATQAETRYDVLGRRIAVVDQEGKITRYRYDGLGRLIEVRQYLDQSVAAADSNFSQSVTAAGVVSTRYSYDEAGNEVTQTDAEGRTTTFWTDTMGRRTKRVLPTDASTVAVAEALQYDGWGNLWKRTDFAGKTTTFAYDVLRRLTSMSADPSHPSLGYSNAAARIEFDYDANGARTGARTFSAANVQLYSETTPRDERGRITYKDTAGGHLGYSYYANNLLNDVVSTNSSGLNVGYRYDEANRLVSLDDGTTGSIHTTSFTYNANGSLETMTQPNAVVHAYSYDALNRLRGLIVSQLPTGGSQPTILHTYEYKLNPAGRRRQAIEGGRTTTYDYDALYRLTGETIAGDSHGNSGAISYTLDKVGNRLTRSSGVSALSSQLNQTYNARDWLGTDSYDANGNTVIGRTARAEPPGTDVYDFANRLIVRTRADGTTVNLTYDADGNRINKSVLDANASPLSATSYLVDTNNLTGFAQVVEERTTIGSGVSLKVYTYGNHLISQATTLSNQPAVVSYFAFDGHGNVRELTGAAGSITDHYDYDAFGNLIFRSGTTSNAYLYCGEQYDTDLGLYFLRARYMNPDSGRFWSMDGYEGKLGDPASLHKYLYASSAPTVFRDPSGFFSLSEAFWSLAISVFESVSLVAPNVVRVALTAAPVVARVVATGFAVLNVGMFVLDDEFRQMTVATGGAGAVMADLEFIGANALRLARFSSRASGILRLGSVPGQVNGGRYGVQVGPAYPAGGAPAGGHNLECTLYDEGKVVQQWSEVSGEQTAEQQALGFPHNCMSSHTEQKAVTRVTLRDGHVLEMVGTKPPCTNCQGAMRTATFSGGRITYEYAQEGDVIINVWEDGAKQ